MTLPAGRWDPLLHESLARMIEDPGDDAPVATFDWDNTVIRGDISEAVLRRLDAEDDGDRLARYEARALHDPIGAWVDCAAGLAGRTLAQAGAYGAETLDLALASGEIAFRTEIVDLISTLSAAGWRVWVVSASLEALVARSAARVGIPAERVVGQRLALDAAGRLVHQAEGPVLYRQGKVEVIEQRIGRYPTFAAGDADTDVEMLEIARHRLVVGPRGPVIAERAAKNGWWVHRGL